jgi:hypothetical protein
LVSCGSRDDEEEEEAENVNKKKKKKFCTVSPFSLSFNERG